MKKIAAGVSVLALVLTAHLASAGTGAIDTTAQTSSSAAPDACAGWTKGGGASVGKANPGRAAASSSSSADSSTDATCAATSSSSSVAYSSQAGSMGKPK